MTDEEQKKVFAENLTDLLSQTGETQKEVADAIGVSPQTFNTWIRAIAIPRMGKVQRLAAHFDVQVTRLLDAHPSTPTLTRSEAAHLLQYRRLSTYQRGLIDQIAENMAENGGGESHVD